MREGCRVNDRDALEAIEDEQIGVAGYDYIGVAVQGQFEKFIVLRVTASDDALRDAHQFGGGEHGAQVVEKGWRNLAGNARPL